MLHVHFPAHIIKYKEFGLITDIECIGYPGGFKIGLSLFRHRARIAIIALHSCWLYDVTTGNLVWIAEHDPRFFASGSPEFITTNEESSGIIDAANLIGQGWFLLDVQAHTSLGGSLVEPGQLLAMYVNPKIGAE